MEIDIRLKDNTQDEVASFHGNGHKVICMCQLWATRWQISQAHHVGFR